MARVGSLYSVGLALAALTTLAMTAEPANAIVYCKTVGVPKGYVARSVAPVARRAVMTPGVGLRVLAFAPAPP